MATTMNLIAKQTVGSGGAASVTFSSIPQTFTDLKLVVSARSSASGNYASIRVSFNGTAYTSNFSAKGLYGNGSSAASENWTQSDFLWATGSSATASTFASNEIYIPNYTSSNNKSMSVDMVTENNATTALAYLLAGLWSNSAAITSITLTSASGTLAEFSEFTLYGISSSSTQNTSVPLASGGDIISTDGTYWYHTFLYSGTFTPLKNLTCDYLVVAGGGGGGGNTGGGGGAGGYRTSIGGTALSLTAQAYTATVGAGGSKGSGGGPTRGSNGGDSIFSTITSSGGGGGGATGTNQGLNGGSGGGSARGAQGSLNGGLGNTPSTSPSQGSNGGNNGSSGASGGGGGASGTGGNATSSGGAGGSGTANSISGTSVTYAGGGGGGAYTGSGGAGGSGGGGNGAPDNSAGSAGTANLGGGGGGGNNNNNPSGASDGYNGGSGIIVLRYAV